MALVETELLEGVLGSSENMLKTIENMPHTVASDQLSVAETEKPSELTIRGKSLRMLDGSRNTVVWNNSW